MSRSILDCPPHHRSAPPALAAADGAHFDFYTLGPGQLLAVGYRPQAPTGEIPPPGASDRVTSLAIFPAPPDTSPAADSGQPIRSIELRRGHGPIVEY